MGKLIGICGLEGSSKTLSVSTIESVAKEKGIDYLVVRMPGGTPLGEYLREAHKRNWDEIISADTELLLMFASFVQLYRNVIEPALEQGKTVITDRFWACTYAYQIYPNPSLKKLFMSLKNDLISKTPHDHILFLDVKPLIGIQRAKARGALDRIEQRDITFFETARQGYLSLPDIKRMDIIDTNRTLDDVQNDVRKWAYNTL